MKLPCSRFTEIFDVKGHSAWPVQNAAVCRVDSRVDVLLFEPPAQPVYSRDRVACVAGAGKYHVDIMMGSIKNVAREGNTRGEKVLSFACIIVSCFPFFPVPLLSNRSQLNI